MLDLARIVQHLQLQQHATPKNELRMRAFAVEGDGGEEAEAAVWTPKVIVLDTANQIINERGI